jgi:crotonobetainyl-CoA:carnitine CoA-transferase CaiB-like acyl-CoA transferase
MSAGALAGVSVLDMSRVLAAPLAAQLLGDLGADVLKVERPVVGDESRTYGPPFVRTRDGVETTDAAFYLSANRNKRSVSVDFASFEGQEIIRALAAQSDVFIENFKTGTLKRYGLDYESLAKINPRLIYCSVTGFGQDGPMAAKPGYDGVFQAMSGLMSVSGYPDDAPGGGPMKVGISMVDILTSLYAANAIQSALYHRDVNGGKGQYIDMSLLDCGFASLSHFAMNCLVSGEIPERRGNGGFGGVPSQAFQCKDGQVFLVAGNDTQFRKLCQAIGRPEFAEDRRFAKASGRIQNRDALLALLNAEFPAKDVADWLTILDAAGVPSGRVNSFMDALSEPQVQHRAMIREIDHPVAGALKLLANPIRLSETPIETYMPPPAVGEHTDSVLKSLGYSPADIAALRDRGVV